MARRVLTHPLFLAAVLLGGFALTVTWTRVASSSDFCATCHETDGVVETAAASARAGAACIDCHGGGSGAGSAFRYVPTLVREALQQTTGWHVAGGVLDARACTSCHDAPSLAAPGESAAAGDAHSDPKSNCESCHGEVAHVGLKGEKPKERQQGDKHPDDWQRIHGLEAVDQGQESCAACHRPEFCSACHLREPVQHPPEWTRTHGQSEGAQQARGCTLCHAQATFCKSCHGVELPHDEQWLEEHPSAAYQIESRCYTCHDQPACALCHQRHETHGASMQ